LRATAGSDLSFLCSRPWGGTDVLDGLCRRLGIDTAMTKLLAKRRVSSPFERVLFGLVANRALAPSSKLAAADWITHDVHIDGLPETSDDACYRAMDWLHDVREHLERAVFGKVANLLNLEVDLLFFDTTSTSRVSQFCGVLPGLVGRGDAPGMARSVILGCEEESIDGSCTTLVRVIRRCFPAPPYRPRWPVSWPCSGRALPLRPSRRSSGWLLV
jgi:hypothetical protein